MRTKAIQSLAVGFGLLFLSACSLTPSAPATVLTTGTKVNTFIAKADTKVVALCAKAATFEPITVSIADAVATMIDPSTGALAVTAIDDAGKSACAAANAAYQGYQVQAPAAVVASAVPPTTTPASTTP